ncbi:MAG: AAA family ATPase [archaeon]
MGAIVAVVGMTGSGKSVVTDFFIAKGYFRVYFGGITMDVLKERNLEVNEANERKVRESLREEYGMAAYAKLNVLKIIEFSKKGNVVLDGLYSWEEYLVLKSEFPKMVVISVYASPKTRYERLAKRYIRPLSNEQAKSRDHSEIENLHKAGPIAIADYTLVNESSIEYIKEILEKIYGELTNV